NDVKSSNYNWGSNSPPSAQKAQRSSSAPVMRLIQSMLESARELRLRLTSPERNTHHIIDPANTPVTTTQPLRKLWFSAMPRLANAIVKKMIAMGLVSVRKKLETKLPIWESDLGPTS